MKKRETKSSIILDSGLYILIENKVKNFMRIRILNPSSELWSPIIKKRKYYYIDDNKKPKKKKQFFITLDIGDLEEAGIQGIAFIRGVLKKTGLVKGDRIKTKDWNSQAIRIEYKAINSSSEEEPQTQIKKTLKKYRKDIISFLSYEYGKQIKDINIVPKDDDFKLEIIWD